MPVPAVCKLGDVGFYNGQMMVCVEQTWTPFVPGPAMKNYSIQTPPCAKWDLSCNLHAQVVIFLILMAAVLFGSLVTRKPS